MKTYLNRKPVDGPWGGGNRFVKALSKALVEEGHQVVYDLQPGIDVVFCFDPRHGSGDGYDRLLSYCRESEIPLIQRVSDLGTHGKPELTDMVRRSVNTSDFLIFPSYWAKDWLGYENANCVVIPNRPLKVFHEHKRTATPTNGVVKIVTHHWSTNVKKGFEIYKGIDYFSKIIPGIEFTYIGRLPEGFRFSGATYLPPMTETNLAVELSKHHIYLTASQEEAGANHVLEAMAAGLPVIYPISGGSILEYCKEHGEMYSSPDQILKLVQKIMNDYESYDLNLASYTDTIDDTIKEYMEIICEAK